MIFLKLSNKFKTTVDDEFLPLLKKYKWHSRKNGNSYEVAGCVDGKKVRLHRFLIKAKTGQIVDHINGDALDNRLGNLRICDIKNNVRNQHIHKNNTSGFKGVVFMNNRNTYKLKKPWSSRIMVDRKTLSLGYFNTKEEAALAYDKAARLHFGEFARTNFK